MSQCYQTSADEGALNTKTKRYVSCQNFPLIENEVLEDHGHFHHHRKLGDSDSKEKKKKKKKKKKKSSANQSRISISQAISVFCTSILLVGFLLI